MRTAELRGPALEYWFAKATGILERDYPGISFQEWMSYSEGVSDSMLMMGWSDFGQIISNEGISLTADPDYEIEGQFVWRASYYGLTSPDESTPFLAVMRVVVNRVYGDVLPEEVKPKVEKAA